MERSPFKFEAGNLAELVFPVERPVIEAEREFPDRSFHYRSSVFKIRDPLLPTENLENGMEPARLFEWRADRRDLPLKAPHLAARPFRLAKLRNLDARAGIALGEHFGRSYGDADRGLV